MLQTKNILVIGDVMIDIYFEGEVNRISPEASVPVFKKTKESYALGGASNVAANLSSAGQRVSILSIIGDDDNGLKLRSLLHERCIKDLLVPLHDRPTTTKTRLIAKNNHQVLRLDVEEDSDIPEKCSKKLLNIISKILDQYDLVVISDYMKGLLTFDFCQGVINIARKHFIKTIVDIKDSRYEKYVGSWLLKPNINELCSITNLPVSTYEEIVFAAEYLRSKTGCDYVLTTCGSKGMVLTGTDTCKFFKSVGKSVYDVIGAGDTTLAYLGASLANGINICDSVIIANYAAGIQVSKAGTSTVCIQEIEEAIKADGEYRNLLK